MADSPAGPRKVTEFLSPSEPCLCCTCETDIVLKYKDPSDGRIKLFKDGELSDAENLVEKALNVSLSLNIDLSYICKNCHRSLLNTEKKNSENEQKFKETRKHSQATYL